MSDVGRSTKCSSLAELILASNQAEHLFEAAWHTDNPSDAGILVRLAQPPAS